MTDDTEKDLLHLDDLLGQARREETEVSQALMARVLADAQAMQPSAAPIAAARQSGFWTRALDGLGGWASVGGLAAASCVGFWIGISPPDGVPDAGSFLLGVDAGIGASEAAELSAFGWDLGEG